MRTPIRYFYLNDEMVETEVWDALFADLSHEAEIPITRIKKDEIKNHNSGRKVMLISGGDGSLNKGINWLGKNELLDEIEVLYHPNGTGNDFARSVGLSGLSALEVSTLVVQGCLIPISLGRFNDSYFVNMATVGCFAEVTPDVDETFKSSLGVWSYYIKAIEKISTIASIDFHFKIDGKVMDIDCVGFFVGNSRYSGGGIQVTPEAEPQDDDLDLLIIKEAPLIELMSLGIELQKANPILDRYNVVYRKIKKLAFSTDKALHLNLDGESYKEKQGQIRIDKKKVKIYLPCEEKVKNSA